MDGAALIAEFRRRADDRVEPYLFDDDELLRYASEAEREACVRARLLWDDSSAFLTIPLVAGQRDYALDERIDRIEVVRCSPSVGRSYTLRLNDSEDLFNGHRLYDLDRTGRPERAARRDQCLRVWPRPHASHIGALSIACYRLPLAPINQPDQSPEIHYQHHEGLVDGMIFRAFSHTDADELSDARAANALAAFTQRFGERPSADVLRRHREKRRVTTRYGGI